MSVTQDQGNATPAKSATDQAVAVNSQTVATAGAPASQDPATPQAQPAGKSGPKMVLQETPAGGEKQSPEKPQPAAELFPEKVLPAADNQRDANPGSRMVHPR